MVTEAFQNEYSKVYDRMIRDSAALAFEWLMNGARVDARGVDASGRDSARLTLDGKYLTVCVADLSPCAAFLLDTADRV